jgi:endonuclease YncB( thermonuclease family)
MGGAGDGMKARNRYANTIGVTIRNTLQALRRAGDHFNHRRLGLFWTVTALSLNITWALKGCSLPVAGSAVQVYNDCAVLSIYDGDTMTVRCSGEKIKVRLYCIDAPEMAQKPWGTMSRDHLRQVTGPSVRLVGHDHDRYGRMVGEVYSGDTNLNLLQVRSGNAAEYDRYCHDNHYRSAEEGAHKAGIGIWAADGLQQSPWEWRHH